MAPELNIVLSVLTIVAVKSKYASYSIDITEYLVSIKYFMTNVND